MSANGHDPSVHAQARSPEKESPQDPASTTPKKKSMASKLDPLLAKLPSWLSTASKDPRKWKTFIRCMVCLFANLVLLVCQPSKFFSSIHKLAHRANPLCLQVCNPPVKPDSSASSSPASYRHMSPSQYSSSSCSPSLWACVSVGHGVSPPWLQR
jgi:hypothetical protein